MEWAGPGQHSHLQFLHVAKPEDGPENSFVRIFAETSSSEQPLLYFIRPDGYVGFRGQAGDIDRLKAYFTRWLSRDPAAASNARR